MPVSHRTAGEDRPPTWQGWRRPQGDQRWHVLADGQKAKKEAALGRDRGGAATQG